VHHKVFGCAGHHCSHVDSEYTTGVYILGSSRVMLKCNAMWLMQRMTKLLVAGR